MVCRTRPLVSTFVVILTLAFVLVMANASIAQEVGPASAPEAALGSALSEPAAIPAGGPGSFSQLAFAFQPYPNQTIPFSFSGRTLFNPDTATHYYEAPVYLPNGATITRFVVWYYDNNTANIWAALARAQLDDSSVVQIGYLASAGAAASVRYTSDTTITAPVVDLESYVYWVEIGLPPNSAGGIVSFRIDYEFPGYLPLVIR